MLPSRRARHWLLVVTLLGADRARSCGARRPRHAAARARRRPARMPSSSPMLNLAPGTSSRIRPRSHPTCGSGCSARLTVGVMHSNPSVDRSRPARPSACATRISVCHTTYHGSWNRRALGGARPASSPSHRGCALLVRELDPFKPALTLGSLVRWTRGRFAITGDPYLQLGLANTDKGNRSALFLPVMFAVQPTWGWELALRTGLNSDLAVIRDGWHVPVAIGTRVRATEQSTSASCSASRACSDRRTPRRSARCSSRSGIEARAGRGRRAAARRA